MSIKNVTIISCDACNTEILDKDHMIVTRPSDNGEYSEIACDGEYVKLNDNHFHSLTCFNIWLAKKLDLHIGNIS